MRVRNMYVHRGCTVEGMARTFIAESEEDIEVHELIYLIGHVLIRSSNHLHLTQAPHFYIFQG